MTEVDPQATAYMRSPVILDVEGGTDSVKPKPKPRPDIDLAPRPDPDADLPPWDNHGTPVEPHPRTVQCPACHNQPRRVRRHCYLCDHTGKVPPAVWVAAMSRAVRAAMIAPKKET